MFVFFMGYNERYEFKGGVSKSKIYECISDMGLESCRDCHAPCALALHLTQSNLVDLSSYKALCNGQLVRGEVRTLCDLARETQHN